MTEAQWVQAFVARGQELRPDSDVDLLVALAQAAFIVKRDMPPAEAAESELGAKP